MDHNEINSLYLGPRGEQIELLQKMLEKVLKHQKNWRSSFYTEDPALAANPAEPPQAFQRAVEQLLNASNNNNPYFHPRYMAQMLKDPAIPAIIGYVSFMLTNPNNHAYEGGPVTTEMEMDVVSMLLSMCGFEEGWGHLCSGGSLANQEALWAARDFYNNNGTVYFSEVSHYSWKRICKILAIPHYCEVPVDEQFHMDLNFLEEQLKKNPALMVVANVGSTGTGSIDNLKGLLELKQRYGFHLHADAAYGGFFRTLLLDAEGDILPPQMAADVPVYVYEQLRLISEIDSITIDPHKQGLISYGAGAVLYKNEEMRQVILNTAPYTYHLTDKPNLGMFTLEGSRPGAMAAACWLTYKTLPLNRSGVGSVLSNSLISARKFVDYFQNNQVFSAAHAPDLDIVCFAAGTNKTEMSDFNRINSALYKEFSLENAHPEYILSKFICPAQIVQKKYPQLANPLPDAGILLRAVFMKHWYTQYDEFYLKELLSALETKARELL